MNAAWQSQSSSEAGPMQLDEATLVRLMRRVVRRAYILATAGCVGLFFISCFRPVRGGFATDAWLMVAMSAGFAVAFILIWGGGPLAAMADERRFGDAGSWLRQFRNLAGLLVVLQVVGAVLSAAHESRFIPWFRTGLMGVRVLMGVFWLAQALDCHRALTMAALGSPREGGANSAGRPNLPAIYVVCLLLGTWTSWAVNHAASAEGQGVVFGVAFVATLALGTRRSGRENSLILGAMVCVVLAGHVPTQWIDPLQERWGYFAGLGFTWGLGLLADLPLIALFWLALRRSEAAPDRL